MIQESMLSTEIPLLNTDMAMLAFLGLVNFRFCFWYTNPVLSNWLTLGKRLSASTGLRQPLSLLFCQKGTRRFITLLSSAYQNGKCWSSADVSYYVCFSFGDVVVSLRNIINCICLNIIWRWVLLHSVSRRRSAIGQIPNIGQTWC